MTDPSFTTFLFGQLSWGALPFVRAWRDPNISEIIGAGAGAIVVFGAAGTVGTDYLVEGMEILVDRVVHEPRPQEDRDHVHRAGRVMLSRALIEAVLIRSSRPSR